LNIFVLDFINILLPFTSGFCDFGKECVDFVILVKNVCPITIKRVLNACLKSLTVFGGEEGVLRGVVPAPSRIRVGSVSKRGSEWLFPYPSFIGSMTYS